MLWFIWSFSIFLGAASIAVITALVLRRIVIQRRIAAEDKARQSLLKSLIAFSHDRDRVALKRAIASVPPATALKIGFEFLSLLRGEEYDDVIAVLVESGLPAHAERQLARGNGAARIHAAEMLSALHPDDAVPTLLATLDRDRGREVRIAAAIALCELGALPPLDATLRKIGAEGQRSMRLVELFRRLAANRLDELMAQVERTDLTPFVRAAVIDALARAGDFRLADFFGGIATDSSPDVASAAVRAVGRIGHPDAAAVLTRAMASGDWSVRYAAAEAAGQLGLPALVAPLAVLLDDTEWIVRYTAAKALRDSSPAGHRILKEAAAATVPSRSQRTASLALSEGPVR